MCEKDAISLGKGSYLKCNIPFFFFLCFHMKRETIYLPEKIFSFNGCTASTDLSVQHYPFTASSFCAPSNKRIQIREDILKSKLLPSLPILSIRDSIRQAYAIKISQQTPHRLNLKMSPQINQFNYFRYFNDYPLNFQLAGINSSVFFLGIYSSLTILQKQLLNLVQANYKE